MTPASRLSLQPSRCSSISAFVSRSLSTACVGAKRRYGMLDAQVLRPLPEPMLARSGSLPTRGRWAFEVKWDGFRAIVRAGADFRVRSRRGWDMTALVPGLEALPAGVYDGELVAFVDGVPYFPAVCARLLNGV